MEMLALAPNSVAVRVGNPDYHDTLPWITFVNYRATLEYDPDFSYPANFADYAIQVEQGREKWHTGPLRLYTEPILPNLWDGTGDGVDPETYKRNGPPVGEAMESLTGMDYFDIHTGMMIGRQAHHGMIFGGDLDLDAIGAAHIARDYTENVMQGLRVWCSGRPDRCEDTSRYDSKDDIEPYNIFDQRWGRQPPFLGVDGRSANYIAGAFDHDLLLTMVDTAAETHDSLADTKDYRTLAGALIDPERYTGDLIQAYLFPGPFTSTPANLVDHAEFMGVNLDEWHAPAEWAEYGTLSAYHLMALADRQEGDEVVTMVALLYPDPADAEAALPELITRLTTYTREFQGLTNEQVLSSLPGNPTIRDSYVYVDPETGWSVAVITLRNDFTYVDAASGETIINTNVLYPVYVQDILVHAFSPLWVADFSDWQAWEN
jgi:hypothetical protein